MEESGGLYPLGSLAHLVGRSLEEIFPGRVENLRKPSNCPLTYRFENGYVPVTPLFEIAPSGERVIKQYPSWVQCEAQERNYLVSPHWYRAQVDASA